MKKKAKTSYEEFIEDDEQKALLDKEYKELLLSELLIAAMEHNYHFEMVKTKSKYPLDWADL